VSKHAIVAGSVLIALSLVAAAISVKFSPTVFIPAAEGLLLIIFGVVARSPAARMHAMHGAATVGLIGALASAVIFFRMMITASGGNDVVPASKWVSVGGMLVVSVGFVILCIKSFIDARRARQAGAATAGPAA
jgi:hypothetical protein